MNKQKRVPPPSASRPILSRGTRMRMLSKSTTINFFGTTISFLPSSLVPINRLNYTKEQLIQFIKDNGPDYCNAIMGVSCGDDGPMFGEWEKLSPFAKWYVAGGRCPKKTFLHFEEENSDCTTGCNWFGCV